jgi:hypothetical protein
MTKESDVEQIRADTLQWWISFVEVLIGTGLVDIGERVRDYPSTLVNRNDSARTARVTIQPLRNHVRFILLTAGPDQSYGLRSAGVTLRIRSIIEHNVREALGLNENL